MRFRPWSVLLTASAATALAVLVAGCGPGTADVLEADPMASVAIEGAETGSITFRDDGGTVLGKPQHAAVTRVMPLSDGSDPAQVLQEAVVTAEDNGWTARDRTRPTGEGSTLLDKTIECRNAQLGISVQGTPARPELVLHLTTPP